MPDTFDINDPLTNKAWSKDLWREHRKADAIWDDRMAFLGSDVTKNGIVQKDELEKTAGDELTIGFITQMHSEGVVGDEVLEGKEGAITTAAFKFKIDDQVIGWHSQGVMSGQRVNFDVLKEARGGLAELWKTRRAVTGANHLCGNSRQTKMVYLGSNLAHEPDDQHAFQVLTNTQGGLQTLHEEDLTSADTLDLDTVGILPELAEAISPPIRPIIFKGSPYYILLVHPNQALSFKQNSSRWYDIMIKGLQGGRIEGNPLFTRAMGCFQNVIIIREPYLVQGRNSSTGAAVNNTRRAVFMGCGALAMGYGRLEKGTMEKFRWVSDDWDHKRKFYGSAGLVWGIKAPFFSVGGVNRDFGKIVVSSWATEVLPNGYALPGTNRTTKDNGQEYTS